VRTGQRDQAVGSPSQPLLADLRTAAILVLKIGLREQLAQTQITGMGLAQQQQAEVLVAGGIVGHENIAADDGLNAGATRLLVELHQPEYVRQVSKRQRRHRIRLRRRYRFANANNAVGDGIFAMQAQVDEGGLHDARDKNPGGILPPHTHHPLKKSSVRSMVRRRLTTLDKAGAEQKMLELKNRLISIRILLA